MTHASLFSGGGGFDLAASTLGWKNVFHCEIAPFCKRLLKYYWPEAISFDDIKNIDATPFKGKIDVLSGGFPCQPFSLAGRRKGTADDRYLWPEMLRIIREIEPTWVVAENVHGILNWNEGLVFDKVHSDLEAAGYEVQTFILPACGVNAPHRRNRVWFIAHASQSAYGKKKYTINKKQEKTDIIKWQDVQFECSRHGVPSHASNPNRNGLLQCNCKNEKLTNKTRKYAQRNAKPLGIFNPDGYISGLERSEKTSNIEKIRQKQFKQFARQCTRNYWRNWPSKPPVCGGNDGLPYSLDGISVSKWRKESLKMYGNAIVPQVAIQIFQAIALASRT